MKTESIKALLDACYRAKRIRELLPALPDGVSPSFIQYLDVIEHLQCRNVCVKISDISDALNIPPLRRDPHRQRHGERRSGWFCRRPMARLTCRSLGVSARPAAKF